MKKGNTLDWIVCLLVLIGGLNWGLIGFFHFNLVGTIFGYTSMVTRVIYMLVGVAALWKLIGCFKCSKSCSS